MPAALLPNDYCGDVHMRLSFYKKLATAKNAEQVDALLEEIVDRFGKLPPQAQTLIDVHRLRVIAKPYGVVKVDAAPHLITITFKKDAPIDGIRVIELIQKNRHIKLAGNEKLRIERELPESRARAQMVRDVEACGARLVELEQEFLAWTGLNDEPADQIDAAAYAATYAKARIFAVGFLPTAIGTPIRPLPGLWSPGRQPIEQRWWW